MTAWVMLGQQQREAFDRVMREGPPPMSENERRAMAAQIYPALLPAMKQCDEGDGFAGAKTSKDLS